MPNHPQTLALIGVPTDLGANNLGADKGPSRVRAHEIIRKLQSVNFAVTDLGDVDCPPRKQAKLGDNPKLHYRDEIITIAEQTAKLTQQAINHGAHPVLLGGDHSIHLGAFAGAVAQTTDTIGLIYFDAHGDMNTDQTTQSGNIHGMQLAAQLGLGDEGLVNVARPGAKLRPEHLLHIGGCDFDQAEKDLVARHGIRTYTMLDVMKHGLGQLFQMIDELSSRVDHLWISLDLDSIDERYAPAASMPNKKGLLYREITALMQHIGQSGKVLGMDVVEYNPKNDPENQTAELAIELISQAFGRNYDWYSDYMSRNSLG